jgi:raffinose/stachyose/melibiose transport system permease protein
MKALDKAPSLPAPAPAGSLPAASSNADRWRRPRGRQVRILVLVLLGFVTLTALFPIIGLLIGSLQTRQEIYGGSLLPESFQWNNYVKAWNDGNFKTYLPNSVFYTLTAVTAIVLISSMAGYALARYKFPGRKIVEGMILAIMIIPAPASFVALYKLLVNMGLANSRLGYVLVLVAGGLPISIFIMRSFFARAQKELEEAAALDGCSALGIFWRVMLPLARPGLAAVAIIQALYAWNEYLMALVLFNNDLLMPVQRGLTNFVAAESPQQNLLLAATMISILPIIVLYIFAQRGIIQGISQGAVK